LSAGDELSSWLDTGYNNLRAQLGPWVGISAVVLGAAVAMAVISVGVDAAVGAIGSDRPAVAALVAVGRGMLFVAAQVLQTWLTLGAWRIALEQDAGKPVDVARLLAVPPRQLARGLLLVLLVYVILGLMAAVVVGVGTLSIEAAVALGLTAAIAALLLFARLQFVYALLVLDLAVFEAIEKSFTLTRGRTGILLAFVLLVGLLAGMGVLACCVGLLVTAPFQWTAGAAALRDLIRRAEAGSVR
jgi:hypothetical protein